MSVYCLRFCMNVLHVHVVISGCPSHYKNMLPSPAIIQDHDTSYIQLVTLTYNWQP